MISITNKLQERIIKILMKKYPVTLDEITKDIRVRKDIVEKEIKILEMSGVISLDVLPDKIFVRLLRRDFMFFHEKKIDRNVIIDKDFERNKEDKNKGYV